MSLINSRGVYYFGLDDKDKRLIMELETSVESYLKLNANRMIIGILPGFDQFMNLVVDNTVEVNGNEKMDIGMVVIRGNNVVIVEALEPVNRTQ
ncbi:hypothetical protein K1719_038924 [Acacia pycnantha]|nr:hypothetical protein K1719_038924 [Acacia pycnantha]